MEENRLLKVGQTTTIEIPFVANSLPVVTWSYNGGKMPVEPKRIKEETIIGMTSLVLAKAKRKDTGKYKVTLENEFGKADFTFNITVIGRCFYFVVFFISQEHFRFEI